MTTKKKNDNEEQIIIPSLNIQYLTIRLVGDTPLICHAWSEKAKLMMLQKQTKKATAGTKIRKPSVEYADSLYWLTEKPNLLDDLSDDEAQKILADVIPKSKFGFPATAFKAAAIDAAYQQNIVNTKTTLRGAIHIIGDLIEIQGTPKPREDMVKIGKGTADLRYRAEFQNWAVTITIKYNANVISPQQIASFFNFGGFSNGVGEWRPSRNGTYGTFHVAAQGE